MDWKAKAVIINDSFSRDFHITLDMDNNWRASVYGLEIGGDKFLTGVSGRGETVEDAVDNFWRKLTELPEDRFITMRGCTEGRKNLRWNGSAFEEL